MLCFTRLALARRVQHEIPSANSFERRREHGVKATVTAATTGRGMGTATMTGTGTGQDPRERELFRADQVLSEKNRKSFLERFQRYRRSNKSLRSDVNEAGVLVPLCLCNGEIGILYTLRSLKVSVNRGQVSFPGGMYDKSADRNLVDTALRETWEELNIPKETVEVWTSGNLIGKKNVNVMPVIGYIGLVEPSKLQVNPDEVEEAFVVSLSNLSDLSQCRFTQFRDGYSLPVYLAGKHRIWGFTAAITHMVLNSLLPGYYKHKLEHVNSILPKKTSKEDAGLVQDL